MVGGWLDGAMGSEGTFYRHDTGDVNMHEFA